MNIQTALDMGMATFSPGRLGDLAPPGAAFPDIPFSEDALRQRVHSHVLLPVPPLSVVDLLERGGRLPHALGKLLARKGSWWYDDPALAGVSREPLRSRWMLLSRHPVLYAELGPARFTYQEHPHLGAPYERLLPARDALYVLLACEAMHGDMLLPENPLALPSADYIVLGFESQWRPGPYTIWKLCGEFLLNTFSGRPLGYPYYGLTEYLEAGDLYEDRPGH